MERYGRRATFMLCGLLAFAAVPAAADEPHGNHGGHGPASGAMAAQHERMAHFSEAARSLTDAFILGNVGLAGESAEKLEKSIVGHETDMPHKRRAAAREFHGLYIELGKRVGRLRADIRARKLSAAAASYGRILASCVECHGKFRD